jgi:hypothetical protein
MAGFSPSLLSFCNIFRGHRYTPPLNHFLLLKDMTKTTSVQVIVGNLNVVDRRELGFLPVLIGTERHKLCGKCLGVIISAANH